MVKARKFLKTLMLGMAMALSGRRSFRSQLVVIKKLISLAGDTHNAWAGLLDVMSPGEAEPGHVVGVEFATSGVFSPGIESAFGPGLVPLFTS